MMDNCFDDPYFGKGNGVFVTGKTELGISKAVVSVPALESRVTRLFSCFYPSKEGFESEVDSYSDVLKNLGIDCFKCGS